VGTNSKCITANLYFLSLRLYDDLLKNRLVFKTTTWLQTLRMRASLKITSSLQLLFHNIWRLFADLLRPRENP